MNVIPLNNYVLVEEKDMPQVGKLSTGICGKSIKFGRVIAQELDDGKKPLLDLDILFPNTAIIQMNLPDGNTIKRNCLVPYEMVMAIVQV